MQDVAYVDGHVYLAGFTQGNASFHSVHVTNGPTGPTTDPDKVAVDHASPKDGETAIMYKITDEGVPVSIFAADILDNSEGGGGYFKGVIAFDDDHIVGVGEYQGRISFPTASGNDIVLQHAGGAGDAKDEVDGFAVKINVKTNKAVWATDAGQMHAGVKAESTSRHVAITAQRHVVVSGDTEADEEKGWLTLLNGDTGALVWQKTFANANKFSGITAVGNTVYVLGQVQGADIDPFGLSSITSADGGGEASAFVAAFTAAAACRRRACRPTGR